LQGANVLLDVREVVDEKRRAVLAGQRLGVASGDERAAGPGLEARPLPPVAGMVVRGGHVAPFRLAVPCAPPQSVSRRGHSAQAGCYSGFDGAARAAAHCTENAVPRARRPSMKYVCTVCAYVYDPEVGDPDNGVEPGTAFDDLPDDWVCPE